MSSDRILLLATQDGIGLIPVQSDGGLGDVSYRLQGIAFEAVCRDASGISYAGSDEGQIYHSEDGKTWSKVFQGFPDSRGLWALAAHPVRPLEIYAGLEPAAVWISRNGGEHWEELSALREHPASKNWRFYEPMKPHIRAIAFNRDGTHLHIGIEEGGNLISRDGGNTFEDRTDGADPDVHTIEVADTDPNLIFALTGDGLYRSRRTGLQWERLEKGLDRSYVVPLAVLDRQAKRLCIGAAGRTPGKWRSHGADAAIYRSGDSGDTWQIAEGPFPLQGMVVSIVIDPGNRRHLFAGTNNGTLLRSSDEGRTWRVAIESLPRIEEMIMRLSQAI